MTHTPLILLSFLLAFALFCAGCRTTYLPPKRPFAGMYPTVMTIHEMQDMHPVKVDVQSLEAHLEEMNILSPLKNAGMTNDELQIVSRGLAQRGYAELDARRCDNCPVSLVLFGGISESTDTIRILAVVNGVQHVKSWPVASTDNSSKQDSTPAAE